jgi:REP element-mobilizing transposase RayT
MPDSTTALAKYRYRRRLPHLQKADADLFITFCTGGPLVLSAPARDLVLEHCLREGGVARAPSPASCPKRIHLHAVVIMPDHVHLLLQPLRSQDGWPYPLVDILQSLKSTTAHHINKRLDHLGPVWEEESFDHVLRSDESLKEKVEYIRQNPVRRGLVKRPEDYKWLWINPGLLNVARAPSPA